ncbi:PREDICTED: uncharacterized protein LOC108567110 [Nicrophorus vespilloides]|uniref:Uncharacterized protein LOC108567110 n=1 Tax=Nicrophorus vespilloides TaxID=110193 RepID=A0ABM1N7S0_NICVS|nr:PREDICTED: uncharacterized protein LOC108567110 [Nicrophorus vespilloides]
MEPVHYIKSMASIHKSFQVPSSVVQVPRMLMVIATMMIVGGAAAFTRSYDLEVPGSHPIRIIEADPMWDEPKNTEVRGDRVFRTEVEHRTLQPNTKKKLDRMDKDEAQDEEDNSHRLKDFLNSYAEKFKKQQHHQQDEVHMKDVEEGKDKSKAWNMLNYEKHNHPYDDKRGWVSMDAVPWSVSKISKWHQNDKPTQDNDRFYSNDYPDYPKRPKPQYFQDQEDVEVESPKPLFARPSAIYNQKVHVHPIINIPNRNPQQQQQHHHDCNKHTDIITDGEAPHFPDHASHQEYANRRRGTNAEFLPTHPFNEDVLPPLKNGKVNMTTSHGGLLQVESTFQTVEEAQKAHAKRQRIKTRNPIRTKYQMKPLPLKIKPTVATPAHYQLPYQLQQGVKDNNPDTASVLAAVGAGMIPAGMALLVPMAMSGRKRRDLRFVTSSPYVDQIEITLPRSF